MSWKEITAGERKYFPSSVLLHVGVPRECRKKYKVRVQRQTFLADSSRATQGVLLVPFPTWPSGPPMSLPASHVPACKVGWNAVLSSLLSLSVRTAKTGAGQGGGFLMWVPVPQDWNKACQLMPGLPAQSAGSSLLPRAALCF